jgi:transposase
LEQERGEIGARRWEQEGKEVERFYAPFGCGAVVGVEATIPALGFERLLEGLGQEWWGGDAAAIRAHDVRAQQYDEREARNIEDRRRRGRFARVWVPSREERDLRQLLIHRLKLVRARRQGKKPLQALASSPGWCWKRRRWSQKGRAELEKLERLPWAARRRKARREGLERWDEQVREGDRAGEEAGRGRPEGALLRTQPGVGMGVALAFVRKVGPIERFAHSRKRVSDGGLNPSEHSRGGRQGLGAISQPGNSRMRGRLIEAAQTAVRFDPQRRRVYQRVKSRRNSGVAKVAIARRLAVRLFGRLRRRHNYAQRVRMAGSPSSAVVPPAAESHR